MVTVPGLSFKNLGPSPEEEEGANLRWLEGAASNRDKISELAAAAKTTLGL